MKAPPAISPTLRPTLTRRALIPLIATTLTLPPPKAALAKPYSDPRFSLVLPDGFATSKRTAKEGTIFVAGNFVKGAVVSVCAWPLEPLLREDALLQALPGIEPPPPAKLPPSVRTLADVENALGGTDNLARVLMRRRDRESSSGALTSVLKAVSADDGQDRLVWSATTDLPVADPEELYKQRGIRGLLRVTNAASFLGTVDDSPAIVTIFGSVLESDYAEFGPLLESSVSSFALAKS